MFFCLRFPSQTKSILIPLGGKINSSVTWWSNSKLNQTGLMGENWIENTLTKKAISFLRTPQKLWVITVIEPSTARGHLSQGPSMWARSNNKKLQKLAHMHYAPFAHGRQHAAENQCFCVSHIPILESNTKDLTRTKHEQQVKRLLTGRSALLQQLIIL